MTQPKIEDVGHGKPVMPFGSDGTDWYALLIDALGHLQVDVVSAALGSGGATEATLASLLAELAYKLETGDLSIEAVTKYLNVVVKTCALPTGAATETTLVALLTELGQKLETGDLSMEAVTKYLNVVVKTSALPTDAATETTLGTIKTALQLIDDFALGTNKLFGYYDRYLEEKSNFSASAGTNILLGTVVPAGEAWVANSLVGVNINTNPAVIRLGIYDGATYYTLLEKLAPGANTRVSLNVPMYLKAGDYLFAYFSSCTLNDDIYLTANGYKMKVA